MHIRALSGKASFFASLTVEAALVMPVFLFGILNLLGMMEIFDVQMRLQAALHQTAKEMAVEGYAYGQLQPGNEEALSLPVQVAFSESFVRSGVQRYVTKSVLDHSVIENGSRGIVYSFSKIMENDRIELIAVYRIAPRFALVPFMKVWTASQAKVRAFTGYDNTRPLEGKQSQEEYVYVTESGSAYHLDRGCSHLKLSIQLVGTNEVKELRNEEGGRYYPCEVCHGSQNVGDIVLITNQGDRYHRTVTCPGLKRTIRTIPLDQASGYHPCGRCAVGG